MAGSYIWLEGVDFSQHIDDTNQIAVIRGASIGLLEAGDQINDWLGNHTSETNGHKKVFSGASLALFHVECDEDIATEIAYKMRRHLACMGLLQKAMPEKNDDLFTKPPFPFAYLRFVTGVAAADPQNDAASIRLAHYRARLMQAQGGYFPPVPPVDPVESTRLNDADNQTKMCGMSRSRIADFAMPLTKAQVERMSLEIAAKEGPKDREILPVSRSVAARRYYGRRARQTFFERIFDKKNVGLGYGFVNDLHELVNLGKSPDTFKSLASKEEPEPDAIKPFAAELITYHRRNGESPDEALKAAEAEFKATLPIQVANKMAVFYADGNGFTKIREEKMGGERKALEDFAEKVSTVLEKKLLKRLLGLIHAHADPKDRWTNIPYLRRFHGAAYGAIDDEPDDNSTPTKPRLRFELLMYGGDELAFIAPAWLGLEIAKLFFDCVEGAKVREHDLTFKAGLALVNYKMPIREARTLAHDLAEFSRRKDEKGNPLNSITIQAFESIEPPANALEAVHDALWGVEDTTLRDVARLSPQQLTAVHDGILNMKKDGFARSQLYNMLKDAQWQANLKDGKVLQLNERKLCTAESNKKAAETYQKYRSRIAALVPPRVDAMLSDPAKAAMNAWLLTHLWDYVDAMGIEQDLAKLAGETTQAAAS